MAEQAKLADADIVLLQEVFLNKDKKEIKRIFGPDYDIFRSKKGLLGLGGGLCGLFRKGFEIKREFRPFKSSGLLFDPTVVDKFSNKGFQSFEIFSPVRMSLVQTHLTCSYEKNLDSDLAVKRIMAEQLAAISRHIANLKDRPLLVCGDFNLEKDQDIMADFIEKSGLENKSVHLHNTILGNFYSPSWLFKSVVNSKKPDYVLTKNIPEKWQIEVKRASDHHELISDHVGVITTIEY